MAYIQVEASVRTHRKFLQAGPAASWLWLCGMGYCQDGLTDGFIPFEALDYLGVKAPKNLKCKLVEVGLWEETSGGWQVHDYLQHNKSALVVGGIKHAKRTAGAAGGRASGEARREAAASLSTEPPSEPHREPISTLLCSTHLDSTRLDAPPRRTPIIARRRLDAAFEGGRVYVPQRVHTDFLSLRNGNERELLEFYAHTDDEWATGSRAKDEPGADMIRFWKARYDERWPATAAVKPSNQPAWMRKAGV